MLVRRCSAQYGHCQIGLTLLEVMVVVAIVAILAAIGVPSFRDWIQNGQIRNASESIQNGLRIAKTEAIKRNTLIRFQLTTSVDSACALSTSGSSWVVSFDNPAGLCANAAFNEGYPAADAANNPAPRILQISSSADGAKNASITSTQNSVAFNAIGRVSPTPANEISINISNAVGGACAADGGAMKCLRILISAGGQIRLCEPAQIGISARGC